MNSTPEPFSEEFKPLFSNLFSIIRSNILLTNIFKVHDNNDRDTVHDNNDRDNVHDIRKKNNFHEIYNISAWHLTLAPRCIRYHRKKSTYP